MQRTLCERVELKRRQEAIRYMLVSLLHPVISVAVGSCAVLIVLLPVPLPFPVLAPVPVPWREMSSQIRHP